MEASSKTEAVSHSNNCTYTPSTPIGASPPMAHTADVIEPLEQPQPSARDAPSMASTDNTAEASSTGGAYPQYYSYKDIFFSDRYASMEFLFNKSNAAEDTSFVSTIFTPNNVQRFFSEGCLVRSLVMGAGGGVLGILFGSFFFTMKPIDVDNSLSFRQQMRQQYKGFLPEVLRTSKGFAKIGFIYSLVECFLERERAAKDLSNAVYAGCITGGALAWKSGPIGMFGGCTMFAAFSALMEKFQPFGGD